MAMHELIQGSLTCPRHVGSTSYLGQKCRCAWWACRCGEVFYDYKLREFSAAEVDPAFEDHLARVGAPLPTVDDTYAELEAILKAETDRRRAQEKVANRARLRLMRAQLRENREGRKQA